VRRRLSAVLLLLAVAVAGCGTAATTASPAVSAAGPAVSASSGTGAGMASTMGSSMASPEMTAGAAQCPTSNTRSFAKTRFVSDLGGAAVLIRRYLYPPYTRGSFSKGHSGRTVALLKAAAATATVVHLLKNASLNAQANPTLCKLVAAPLASLTSTVSGLTGSLGSGAGLSALGGLGGAVTGLLGKAKAAGVPVTAGS